VSTFGSCASLTVNDRHVTQLL